MENINIDISDLEPIHINLNNPPPSSFGSGIELLMNDKVKSNSNSVTINMKELDDLENELNELSSVTMKTDPNPSSSSSKTIGSMASNFFGFNSNGNNVKNVDEIKTDSNLGHATVDSIGNTKTWDGFTKLGADVPNTSRPMNMNMNEREKRRKKRAMLKSLEQWQEKGMIKGYSNLNMESSYEEIEDEYEGALEDKRKKDSVKIQQNWLVTMINTIEYGNAFFDPFGICLDGWGESVSEDVDSYNEIFEQLHEKYKGGKMSPELSLLLRLGFSASVIHFSNKALSTATPGFNDVIKQSPELMRMFTNATVDSMKQTAPGMSFASELLNQNKSTSMNGPPPAPVETRNYSAPPRPGSMQFTPVASTRPDIQASRGGPNTPMFREQGIELNNSSYINAPSNSSNQINHSFSNPSSSSASNYEPQERSKATRPEMTAPTNTNDISSILSGLKTTKVNIHDTSSAINEDDSMISISSLKDMQNPNMPKRSNRRKTKSDKNVISLDI
jgi:hypothetical protein